MESVMHAASLDRMSPEARRTPSGSAKWLRAISITSAAMLMASCNEGVLDPRGPVGKAERVILYDSTAIMLAVVIPAIVVLFLGGIAWTGSHDLDPPAPLSDSTAPLDIEVISLDWRWLFIYPHEGTASLNRLVVPAGVPLRFRLTSTTAI